MILADKIIELRKKNGWSQEELAEQLDVSRQSVSKWESAQSVPDMNRILKLSEVFGVSTDVLLKDELELQEAGTGSEAGSSSEAAAFSELRNVSMEEASAYLTFKQRSSGRIAMGVMMCILSPVLELLLTSLQEAGRISIAENIAVGVGLTIMFLLIGGAVAIFIMEGISGNRFEYLEKELLDTAYGVDGMVRDRREKFRHTYTVQLVSGIVLCVVSVLPVFAEMMFLGENAETGIGEACLLVLVAAGVFLIVRSCIIWGSYNVLLEEGDYTREKKEEGKKNELLDTIYWCSATAVYLAISFLTGAWGRTWIVWPVAGVAYGVVTAAAKLFRQRG